jgi:ankyrin repeat protein
MIKTGKIPVIFWAILGGGLATAGMSPMFSHDEKPRRRSTDPPIAARGKMGQDVFIAVGRRDTATLKSLFDKGADPNARNGLEFTPLFIATASHNAEAMDALLQAGADPNINTNYGTALTFGAMTGNVEGVNMLLARGVKLDPPRADSKTPLMMAAYTGVPPIVATLIEKKADVNAKDDFGATALDFAARGGHVDVANILIGAGAKIEVKDDEGTTPLMAAAMNGRTEMVKLLLQHGAKPNERDHSGRSALLLAAQYGDYPEIVRELIKAGANPGAADMNGRSAAAYAVARGHDKTAALLGKPSTTPRAPSARVAVDLSLKLLQSSMNKFAASAACLSCHHEGLGRMVTAQARERGLRVDPELQASQTARTSGAVGFMAPMHAAALKSPEAMKQIPLIEMNEVTSGYSWLMAGMAAQNQPRTKGSDLMAMVLARQQTPSGAWTFDLPRIPMQSSNFTFTALAIRSIRAYAPRENADEVSERITKGKAWLMDTPAMTSEDRASKLLGLKWAGASADECDKATKAIAADQHADGGWSQMPDMPSDAYATGQALYAMHHGGGLATTDPVYRRGVAFLLRTQDADGSWFANKRALPANNHFDAGFPHGQSQYASFNATCYATMALLDAMDAPRKKVPIGSRG